jgi:hypothetical protein
MDGARSLNEDVQINLVDGFKLISIMNHWSIHSIMVTPSKYNIAV